MKKVYIVILIFLSLLCFGCQNNRYVRDSETENESRSNTEEEGKITKNTEIGTNSNNKNFSFSEDKIVNLSQVTQMFDWSDIHGLTCNYEVEIQLEDDSVPKEIIEVLISENDRDETNDELYKNYLSVDYIAIDIEAVDNTDFGNCVSYDLIKNRGIIDIMQVDIDYDSEYEYLVEYGEGSDGQTALSVFKNVKEEMKEVYYIFDEDTHYELLELNDRYYILAGNFVAYYDLPTGDWCSVNLNRTVKDFHEYEFYSESQLEEDIIFQDIDLVHKEDWEKQKFFTFEFICGNPLVLERQIDEETYYYVCTDFQNHERRNQDDRLLFIIRENGEGDFEIIKAYYLEAELHLFVE